MKITIESLFNLISFNSIDIFGRIVSSSIKFNEVVKQNNNMLAQDKTRLRVGGLGRALDYNKAEPAAAPAVSDVLARSCC